MWSIPSEPRQHFSVNAKDSTTAIPAVSGVIKKTETMTRGWEKNNYVSFNNAVFRH